MTTRKKLTFHTWIQDEGIDSVAKLLGVTPGTVSHWRRGHCYPRVEQMRMIKEVTKGKIGYDDIIDSSPISTGGLR